MAVVAGIGNQFANHQAEHRLKSSSLFCSLSSVNTVTITGTSALRDIHQSRYVKSLSVALVLRRKREQTVEIIEIGRVAARPGQDTVKREKGKIDVLFTRNQLFLCDVAERLCSVPRKQNTNC
jgi:hypothetical protein